MTYMTRKRFLGSLTAISATASIASWSKMAGGEEPLATTTTDQPSSDKTSRFADRVFEDSARMLCGSLS